MKSKVFLKHIFILLIITAFISCKTHKPVSSNSQIIFGKYGTYADWSNFEELYIGEDGNFDYTEQWTFHRHIVTHLKGKWKLNKGILELFEIDIISKTSNERLPRLWVLKDSSVCRYRDPDSCLEFQEK